MKQVTKKEMEKELELPLIILFCFYLVIVPVILYFICPVCAAYEFSGQYVAFLFFILFIVFCFIPYLFSYFTRKWNPDGSIAVRSGDKLADWGDGWVWIPPLAGKALYYNHKPQRLEKRLILTTKDGLYFEAQAHIVWSVNREALDKYFDNPEIAKDIDVQSTASIQRWARERSLNEIQKEQPENLKMPLGTKLVSITLLEAAPTERTEKMTQLKKKDFSHQLHGIIDNVETIAEAERLRKTLREQMPDLATDIDQFCYQHIAKLKTGRR